MRAGQCLLGLALAASVAPARPELPPVTPREFGAQAVGGVVIRGGVIPAWRSGQPLNDDGRADLPPGDGLQQAPAAAVSPGAAAGCPVSAAEPARPHIDAAPRAPADHAHCDAPSHAEP